MTNADVVEISFTVLYAGNSTRFDVATAEAILGGAGLTPVSLIAAFETASGHKDLIQYFVTQVNLPQNSKVLIFNLNEAKTKGNTSSKCDMERTLYDDIQMFLKKNNSFRDVLDAANKDLRRAYRSVDQGLVKDIDESGNDVKSGLRDFTAGGWQSLNSPVFSARYKQGDEQLKRGMDQFVKGWGKFLLQTPIDMWLAGTLGGATLGKIGRTLYSPEKTVLQSVFGTAVEYDLIIIKQGYAEFLNAGDNNGLTLTNNTRAITIGNTIYMKDDIPSTPDWNSTLVHETTHVWQHQHGGTDYMSEALYAQFTAGYGYADEIFNRNKTWGCLIPNSRDC